MKLRESHGLETPLFLAHFRQYLMQYQVETHLGNPGQPGSSNQLIGLFDVSPKMIPQILTSKERIASSCLLMISSRLATATLNFLNFEELVPDAQL